MKIGETIKNLRLARNLSQEDLATRVDLNKGFISMLERDLTSPSLDTLELILGALGTTPNDFFASIKPQDVVFNPEKRVVIDNSHGIITERLTASAKGRHMDFVMLTLQPGTSTAKSGPHHGDECGLVLSGRLTINLGKDSYKANKNDAFYYASTKEHWIENKSNKEAKFIWISSPPEY